MNLRDTGPLPTCWYCPFCGTCAEYDFQTFYFDQSMKLGMVPDYDRSGHWTNGEPAEWCENLIAEVPLIPPDADLRSVFAATGAEVTLMSEFTPYGSPPTTGRIIDFEGDAGSKHYRPVFVVSPRGEVADGC